MAARRNRQRNQLFIVGGVMSVLAIAVGVLALGELGERGGDGDAPAPPQQEAAAPASRPPSAEPVGPPLVADDGRTLWVSPTDGPPLSLAWLPPDCQLILALRPAEMLAQPQGRLAADALGPTAAKLVEVAEGAIGLPLADIAQLTIGIRPAGGDALEATLVVEPVTPLAESGGEFLPAAALRGRSIEHADAAYRLVGDWCYYAPAADGGDRFVVASRLAMHELLDAGGAPPPLRRELEQLAAASDATRHASLLVPPSFLFTEGKGLFEGDSGALREPLFEETPDDLRAALVSMQFGDLFFWELRAAPAADTTARRLAAGLEQRIGRWPGELQLAVLQLNPAPHGRRVVAQLPLMLGVLAKHARYGVVDRHAVVNGYLPAPAGHNLLLAAELMLAQQSAGGAAASGATGVAQATPAPRTTAERLRARATVVFSRDTLEMAVQYLSDEIGVPIVILGGDLQLEGITKNQSFGLDASDTPAEQVLLQILTRANPDKTASGPADPKQKLVYVVRPDDDGRDAINVTTRAAAAKRGETLPRFFRE